ncbi:MAG: hypothetical protein PHF00_01600 [Elusimicrobia bacterium]|nr:hypothetical protein [Elusimicrobiota bacterium]
MGLLLNEARQAAVAASNELCDWAAGCQAEELPLLAVRLRIAAVLLTIALLWLLLFP